ncbi:DUF3427 domain-containing protein [Streptococcus zalophi]|uniref:DEAD/DEAH box helicase n=1 Tax=Streptococcus zalophi TaxID=640031 RepID=A0A934PA43_9STRE|nr:DEAD/DEAH box helicase [Streptococcus zalophi]MBJ8349882.1 DEAD/DEAH box helicase [Streptococcus zalophi]
MDKSLFQNNLLESLKFGFIDYERYQNHHYAPKIVINSPDEKRFVLSEIQEELSKSIAFYFSVAFVTQSGIALIKSQLADLALKNVKGKIIISPYLDFNEPLAMKELLKLKNVEVRISDEKLQLHSKYYLFEQHDKQVMISGSSNLTGNALKNNYEWNIKLTSTDNGNFIKESKKEFERIWEQSIPLTNAFIEKYKLKRKMSIQIVDIQENKSSSFNSEINPNKMQEQALVGLENIRKQGKDKALIISATGTGKTYLSAFDVREVNPRRVLFIVHREQILRTSLESFQKVIKFNDEEACIYKTNMDISSKKYIFATIQTLSKDENLKKIRKDFFDYILIDEVHKAGAVSYKKIIDYFSPKFLLGMTATPERTDGQNIFELFDYNIAYEIRLQEALDNDLLCPFLYFGVTDIKIDGSLIDEKANFSNLVSSERLKHIIDKITYYGHSGEKVKGLIFCSTKKEAKELSRQFNRKNLKSLVLTGEDSQIKREEAVEKLEKGQLDYLFTVDIFNEGIDIPSVNQVVMLRNTQSSIVFIQQLGRGLRKHKSKDYVTIIDFIGNYKNNYLIPIALFGDKTMNKDNYRREVREASTIKGLTTVNFEEIAKKQIFDAITNTSLSSIKILRESFVELKNKLGRSPMMLDYIKYHGVDPLTFFENSRFSNYIDVVNKFSNEIISITDVEERYLNFITFELLSGKRPHELYLLMLLINNNGQITHEKWLDFLHNKELTSDNSTLTSINRVLNLKFLKAQEQKKYGTEALVSEKENVYYLNKNVLDSFQKKPSYAKFFLDVLETGLEKSKDYPEIFTLNQKYSRRDILKLLNVKKDEPSLNIGGYKIDKETNSCPIFITYHKSEDISDTIKYEDELINETTLIYFSKNKRTKNSPDVSTILNSNQNNLRLELFVKKNDAEGGDFYYLGSLNYIENSAMEINRGGDSVVKMLFSLNTPIEPSLYRYLTTNIK